MADLFREVDDVMRQERITKFWTDNKPYIIAFVVGTILLTAAISGYRSWNNAVKEKQTASLITLQEAADYPTNILETEKLKMRAGLRGVALLQAAGAFLDKDKRDEAITLYERASADKALPDDLQHLGILMAVRLLIDDEAQTGESLLKKLSPVLKASKSPWSAHARLEAAVINAHKLSNYEAALTHLNAVQETKDLPESVYQRSRALSHLYSLKQKSMPQNTKEKTEGAS